MGLQAFTNLKKILFKKAFSHIWNNYAFMIGFDLDLDLKECLER